MGGYTILKIDCTMFSSIQNTTAKHRHSLKSPKLTLDIFNFSLCLFLLDGAQPEFHVREAIIPRVGPFGI